MSNSKGCYWCGCCDLWVRVSRIGVALPNLALEAEVDADLDTLATGLYVTSDDFLADNPQYRPLRPRVGLAPRLTDAELVTLVVLQALLGFTSEARFLRYADTHLRGLFPYLPTQSGYNKRIRAVIAHLVARTSIPRKSKRLSRPLGAARLA